MQSAVKERLAGVIDAMSPRARQWATVGGISAVAVGILWVVFAMGSGEPAQRATGANGKPDLKPTNVDLMAPGS